MKKAEVELIYMDTFTVEKVTSHILQLSDKATDDDLLEQISELENKTEQVCSNWEWCSPVINSRALEQHNQNTLKTLEQL